MSHRTARHDPNEQLEFLLHALSRSLLRTYDREFRKLGLTQSQAGVLLQVDWADAFTQTEIARRLGIGKAAAGVVIIELESRGLVRRSRSTEDSRMIGVTLTRAGSRKVKEINDFVERLGPFLREGIDDDEWEQALSVLRRLRANADAMEEIAAQAAGSVS